LNSEKLLSLFQPTQIQESDFPKADCLFLGDSNINLLFYSFKFIGRFAKIFKKRFKMLCPCTLTFKLLNYKWYFLLRQITFFKDNKLTIKKRDYNKYQLSFIYVLHGADSGRDFSSNFKLWSRTRECLWAFCGL